MSTCTSYCFPVFTTLAVDLVVEQQREQYLHKAPRDCYDAVIIEINIQYHCMML